MQAKVLCCYLEGGQGERAHWPRIPICCYACDLGDWQRAHAQGLTEAVEMGHGDPKKKSYHQECFPDGGAPESVVAGRLDIRRCHG
jgi:hypothetical protein